MVKKLFKHEMKAWLRIMAVIWTIMIAFAGLYRLFLCFENDSVAYSVISALAAGIFIFFLFVCLVFCEVFGVVRFYKNLFTGEGYLSFTLPVTVGNHLWVKALTTAMMTVITVLLMGISLVIISSGELLTEIGKAAAYLWGKLPQEAIGHIWGYMAEIFVFLLVAAVFTPMLYYACICIGQLFRKHRILGAVGVYFGYHYLCQIIGTVLIGILSAFVETNVEEVVLQTTEFPYEALHILFGIGILWTVGIGMLYFAVSYFIMRKKLNLE